MNIDLRCLLEIFNKEYTFLYNNNDRVEGYADFLEEGDEFIKSNPEFIGEFVKQRGDFISSDREVVALMMTLYELNIFKRKTATHYIGRKMIEDGLMSRVIVPKLEADGLKAYIGRDWFYFGGSEFEHSKPDEIPFEALVEEIKSVLDCLLKNGKANEDEYKYYHYCLCKYI